MGNSEFSFFTFSDRPFELSDGDAFATLASRILGERRYAELKRQTASLPNGMANDRIVDEAMRVLNHTLVRMAIGVSR